jgi:hypothetical protein
VLPTFVGRKPISPVRYHSRDHPRWTLCLPSDLTASIANRSVMSPNVRGLRPRCTEGNMKALTIGGAVLLLLCAGGTRVEAQGGASSFDQLGVLVQPGYKIRPAEKPKGASGSCHGIC